MNLREKVEPGAQYRDVRVDSLVSRLAEPTRSAR
jgi:hypothetical protein